MKRILFLAVFTVTISTAIAAGADSRAGNQLAKRTATELFSTSRGESAVAHLRANLQPESGPDGATTAVVQSLVEIASTLYNQRQTTLAREVALQAFAAADQVIKGNSGAAAKRRSELLGSLAVLSEEVLLDLKSAEILYDAASTLNSGNPINAQRKRAVVQKQKAQNGTPGR